MYHQVNFLELILTQVYTRKYFLCKPTEHWQIEGMSQGDQGAHPSFRLETIT